MPCDYRFINAVHESENLKVEFGVKNNCNLFAQGDTVRYFINVNGMVPELKVAYIYFFNDAFGVSKYIEDEIVYENDGNSAYIEGEVPIKDTYKNGIYTFYLTIRKVGSLQFNIGVVPRADRASSDFYYGVQPYITKSGINAGARVRFQDAEHSAESLFAAIDYMGCNLIREELTAFHRMQPEEGGEINPEIVEPYIKRAKSLGMDYMWLMQGSPEWAVSKRHKESKFAAWQLPPDIDVWRKYVSTIATYYKDYKNIIFEIWNEADWEFFQAPKEEYFELLDAAIEEIFKISPDARVLPSSCVSGWELSQVGATHSKGRKYYFQHYLPHIRDKKLIGLNVHDHRLFNETVIDEFKNLDKGTNSVMALGFNEAEYRNRWITESGAWTPLNNMAHRAQTLMAKMLYYRAQGAKSFVEWEFSSQSDKSCWSIFNYTMQPEPAVISWTYQVGLLGNAKFKEQLIAPSGYAFADIYTYNNKTIVPFYSHTDDMGVLSVDMPHRVYDIYGNEFSSNLSYQSSKSPIYLVFEGLISGDSLILK